MGTGGFGFLSFSTVLFGEIGFLALACNSSFYTPFLSGFLCVG
ncbi:hypothetical protein RchiOBHm_Chr2g0152741 [Rosa chinensis]|uniref:Uncharacterized protein n=1 Tax=Rosa chinensis TaxID=74649 RepID=A0A2P6S0H6_ROSCH|nr:hypothetical protein RchiOBHm_Chr2g0152741 [Rosa chinensis]